jgi:hypothetical protein
MGLSTVTFTMRNEGFRPQYVAPYSKAILGTALLDEAKCIAGLVVLGIPCRQSTRLADLRLRYPGFPFH